MIVKNKGMIPIIIALVILILIFLIYLLFHFGYVASFTESIGDFFDELIESFLSALPTKETIIEKETIKEVLVTTTSMATTSLVTTTTIESPTCTDTDGGHDIWNMGSCSDASGVTTEICPLGDFTEYISEAYCHNDVCMGESVSCYFYSATCYQGRCIAWNQDSDGDGYPDLDEYEQGTDPNDSNDNPGTGQDFIECQNLVNQYGYDFFNIGIPSDQDCYDYANTQCGAGMMVMDWYWVDGCCMWTCMEDIDCDTACSNAGYDYGGYRSGGVSCDDFEHYLPDSQCCCGTIYTYCESRCYNLGYTYSIPFVDTGWDCYGYASQQCSTQTTMDDGTCCCWICY